jgi:hypothetical protein
MSLMQKLHSNPFHSSLAGATFLIICGIVVASCDLINGDVMDQPARSAVSEDVLAGKPGGISAALTSAYAALHQGSMGSGSFWESAQDNWVYGSVAGGEAYKGSEAGDQAVILTIAQMQHDPSIGYFNSKWEALFEGVARANSVLSLVDRADVSESERTRIVAEARFLRAHYYFDLKRNYGNVPWISDTTENLNQPNTGEGHPDIWNKIEEDFQFAKANLPNTPSEPGRAYRWAAQAYLGKTYLYQEEWESALTELEEVINNGNNLNGNPFELTPAYQNMFRQTTENNSGTVFSIQNTGPTGAGDVEKARSGSVLNFPRWTISTGPDFYHPSQWFVNAFRVDEQGHPLNIDAEDPRSTGTPVKDDQGISSDEKFTLGTQTLDPRLEWTAGRRGVPYLDWGPFKGKTWIREQSSAGPFVPKKHVFRRANQNQARTGWGGTGTADNYKVIRFADVLLMAAEAKAELGRGDLGLSYVNRVRERASNPESNIENQDLNKDFALDVVQNRSDVPRSGVGQFSWVVVDPTPSSNGKDDSTFVFIGGNSNNIDNWNKYDLPEYDVQPYNSFSGRQDALKKIRYERMLELGMEGHRFYDLVRWGIADDQLDKYYQFEVGGPGHGGNLAGGDFTPDKNEYYPIPQRQIDLSVVGTEPVLEQNPGYAGGS